MKRWFLLLLPVFLTGCPLDEKIGQTACYEIANPTSQPSPILLNKCTGETYIMLKNDHNDGTTTWAWYMVGKIDSINFVKSR